MRQITASPTPSKNFTHVKQWCAVIDKLDNKIIKQKYIEKAKELREFLLSSVEKEYLCHGDLHLENIIQHGEGWLSIDPKGILGEMAFEAAAFDLIDKAEWAKPDEIPNKIKNRVNLLADNLDLDPNRLLAWVYLRVMISAQWFIEDNGDPSEMLRSAEIIYPMFNEHLNIRH